MLYTTILINLYKSFNKEYFKFLVDFKLIANNLLN